MKNILLAIAAVFISAPMYSQNFCSTPAVTTQAARQGPVTVSSGKTRIFGEDITIKNNFTVVNGAELYIGN